MHDRSWSGHICVASTWPKNSRWARSLISSTTNAATASQVAKGIVVPDVKTMIHGGKCKITNFSTRATPGVTKSSICDANTGARCGWMMHWSEITNIWTGVSSRWCGCMFTKNSMLAHDIRICISPLTTSSTSTIKEIKKERRKSLADRLRDQFLHAAEE